MDQTSKKIATRWAFIVLGSVSLSFFLPGPFNPWVWYSLNHADDKEKAQDLAIAEKTARTAEETRIKNEKDEQLRFAFTADFSGAFETEVSQIIPFDLKSLILLGKNGNKLGLAKMDLQGRMDEAWLNPIRDVLCGPVSEIYFENPGALVLAGRIANRKTNAGNCGNAADYFEIQSSKGLLTPFGQARDEYKKRYYSDPFLDMRRFNYLVHGNLLTVSKEMHLDRLGGPGHEAPPILLLTREGKTLEVPFQNRPTTLVIEKAERIGDHIMMLGALQMNRAEGLKKNLKNYRLFRFNWDETTRSLGFDDSVSEGLFTALGELADDVKIESVLPLTNHEFIFSLSRDFEIQVTYRSIQTARKVIRKRAVFSYRSDAKKLSTLTAYSVPLKKSMGLVTGSSPNTPRNNPLVQQNPAASFGNSEKGASMIDGDIYRDQDSYECAPVEPASSSLVGPDQVKSMRMNENGGRLYLIGNFLGSDSSYSTHPEAAKFWRKETPGFKTIAIVQGNLREAEKLFDNSEFKTRLTKGMAEIDGLFDSLVKQPPPTRNLSKSCTIAAEIQTVQAQIDPYEDEIPNGLKFNSEVIYFDLTTKVGPRSVIMESELAVANQNLPPQVKDVFQLDSSRLLVVGSFDSLRGKPSKNIAVVPIPAN